MVRVGHAVLAAVMAAQRQAHGHADLDRRRQDRDPCLRGRDQPHQAAPNQAD